MVSVMSLWLPIVLSAVFVFIASSLIHMLLTYHKSDYKKLPDEDGVLDALRKFNIPPGDYLFPKPDGPKEMKEPAFQEKWKRGPVGMATMMVSDHNMGKTFGQWFLYCAIVGAFAGYVAGRALPPGTAYPRVFELVAVTSFMGYGLALWQYSIWYRRSYLTTFKSNIDSVVYALLTAGTFGWLWPK